MSSEPENHPTPEPFFADRRVLLLSIVAVVALVVTCILAFALLQPLDDGGDSLVGDVTPSPFPTTDAREPDTVIQEPLVMGVSDTDTITVSLDVPVFLSLAGEKFAVKIQFTDADGQWLPSLEGDKTAAWVYGSIINYIVGLPDSEANRALVAQLVPGDEMVLTTRRGIEHAFVLSSRETVASGRRDVFAQNTPGLTLILLGAEGEDRLVINGRYLVPEATSSGQASVFELGETIQFEDIQLTVTGASYVLDRPEAPPGFAFYLVDYQLQNVGLTALDTNKLRLLLLDGLGNQFVISPGANQLGNHRPLTGFLNSNQMVEATAGYQIPIGLNAAALSWVVARDDTGGRVQVTIPFGGGGDATQRAEVSLAQVEVSSDRSSLVLNGQVMNLGSQPLLVNEQDIRLTTADGSVYLLLATNPPFPWTISSGQSIQYRVTYQWPLASDSAIFSVLNQSFELSFASQ